MSDPLFSDVLIVDRGRIVPPPSALAPNPSAPAPTGRHKPRSIAKALAEALARASGQPASTGFKDVEALAEAMADFVAGRSVILRLKPDLSEHSRAAVGSFLSKVVQISGILDASRQEAAIAKLAEVLLPDKLADARGALASDNLELRDRWVGTTSPLNSAEVAALAGSKSSNPYSVAARWKKSGKVFSVHHRGAEYFPSFQFREGQPHPTVKKVLAALPGRLSPWQRAFWFASANGWLNDKAPSGLLDQPEAVVAAAEREAQAVVG